MIDVNVYVSRWPFRRLPDDETPRLVERLRRAGVTSAWAGSFDALLHRDVAAVNTRLAAECREHGEGLLVPFGAVNPTLPDWKEDVRRCAEEHGMPGVRLHPDYHGYKLDDPRFAELLDVAGERNLIVQVAARMEDERTRHPLLKLEPIDLRPLVELVRVRPGLRVVVLNALRVLTAERVAELAAAGQVYFEIATLEGVDGLARLLKVLPHERLLFGSLFPFFYLDSAVLKLREAEAGQEVTAAIEVRNATRLLERTSAKSAAGGTSRRGGQNVLPAYASLDGGAAGVSFAFDGVVDLFAVDADLFGGVDAEADLVASYLDHHQGDVVTDDDLFVLLTAEHEHRQSLPCNGDVENSRRRTLHRC